MRILGLNKLLFLMFFAIVCSLKSFSQNSKITIQQDVRFEELLNEKRKINTSITIYDRYKIQIFTGDNVTSKKALTDFRKENRNLDGTIVFSTPIYKVWVGNFKTRIEAEKKLQEFKKKYPIAFLVKPNKS